jgi:hypothetical protein
LGVLAARDRASRSSFGSADSASGSKI